MSFNPRLSQLGGATPFGGLQPNRPQQPFGTTDRRPMPGTGAPSTPFGGTQPFHQQFTPRGPMSPPIGGGSPFGGTGIGGQRPPGYGSPFGGMQGMKPPPAVPGTPPIPPRPGPPTPTPNSLGQPGGAAGQTIAQSTGQAGQPGGQTPQMSSPYLQAGGSFGQAGGPPLGQAGGPQISTPYPQAGGQGGAQNPYAAYQSMIPQGMTMQQFMAMLNGPSYGGNNANS